MNLLGFIYQIAVSHRADNFSSLITFYVGSPGPQGGNGAYKTLSVCSDVWELPNNLACITILSRCGLELDLSPNFSSHKSLKSCQQYTKYWMNENKNHACFQVTWYAVLARYIAYQHSVKMWKRVQSEHRYLIFITSWNTIS